jgi:hypothetical protein
VKPNRIREAFKTFPAVLQHQILLRLGMALGSSFFFTFCWLLFGEFVFASPFLLLAVWMGYSGIQMFRTIASGSYTRIRTTCKQVITTAILKRPKAMILSTEKGDLRLRIQQRIRKPEVGEQYDLFLADNTTVYQDETGYIASAYLGIMRVSR